MNFQITSDIFRPLIQWVSTLRSPYTEAKPNKEHRFRFHPNGVAGSSVELVHSPTCEGKLKITFTHALISCSDMHNRERVMQEVEGFNHLMESVQLPTYIWHNIKEDLFELHWTDQLSMDGSEFYSLQNTFKQSLLMANSVASQLSWQAKKGAGHLTHTLH